MNFAQNRYTVFGDSVQSNYWPHILTIVIDINPLELYARCDAWVPSSVFFHTRLLCDLVIFFFCRGFISFAFFHIHIKIVVVYFVACFLVARFACFVIQVVGYQWHVRVVCLLAIGTKSNMKLRAVESKNKACVNSHASAVSPMGIQLVPESRVNYQSNIYYI